MKILVHYDQSAPKYHRVLLPAHGLQQQHGWEVKVTFDTPEQLFEDIDILFFNRLIAGTTLDTILGYKAKYGFKMVCDLDDHWQLGPDHVLYENYKKYGISEMIEEYVKASDLVTVTHERLREAASSLNESVAVFPNAIPKIDQFLVQRTPSQHLRLFWAGGTTHRNDLELLRRPLQLIKRDKVKLVVGGFKHNDPEWKEMAKIYTTDSAYNTAVIENLPVHEYYKVYSQCDISLIPLVKNTFNEHKSNLKILEAANIGVPVIVSKVHPYLGFPEHLVNYVDGNNTFYSQITKLIKDEELRRVQGAGLQAYCDRHYNFLEINSKRNKLFHETIQPGQVREIQEEARGVA